MNLLSIYFLQIKLDGNYSAENSRAFQEAGMQIILRCMSQLLKGCTSDEFPSTEITRPDRILQHGKDGI